MDDGLEKRLKYLITSATLYSSQCSQLAAHLTDRATTLLTKAGLGQQALRDTNLPQWCPRCSTHFTPSSSHWRTMSSRVRHRRKHRGSRHMQWLNKPPRKHRNYLVVHCWSCDATVAAGGMSNTSLKNKGDKIKRESFVMDKSPALDLSTPNNKRHGKSTPSNRKQCDSTPSNKRRRSSTLKAQLAKSSSHQRQLEVGTSPNLSAFLSSIL